jgi:hypothetical protein
MKPPMTSAMVMVALAAVASARETKPRLLAAVPLQQVALPRPAKQLRNRGGSLYWGRSASRHGSWAATKKSSQLAVCLWNGYTSL